MDAQAMATNNGTVASGTKKRGRPKGSKNKTKTARTRVANRAKRVTRSNAGTNVSNVRVFLALATVVAKGKNVQKGINALLDLV